MSLANCVHECRVGGTVKELHREAEKKEPIFFCVHILMIDRNWWIFFTNIKESLSYNSMYLILAYVKNSV